MYKLSIFYKKGVKLYRPTEEEVKRRQEEYKRIRSEEIAEKILKIPHKKRADGKYDVYGNVYLDDIRLISLLEVPIRFGKVYGDFSCRCNHLRDLKGAPEYVRNGFDCGENQLISLEGAPKYVGGSFYCNNNQLVSLEGAPEYVGRYFSCSDNQLISLEGAPKYVGKNFNIADNPKKFTEEEVRKVVDVKGEVYV